MSSHGAESVRRAANPWDRFYKDQKAPWRGERELATLRPYMHGRILELGCGNGKLLKPLLAGGYEAIGLDIAWHPLQRLGHGILGDAAVLPVAAGSVGTIMDIHCTGHLDAAGRPRAAAEQYRVLQPGGHTVVRRLGTGDMRATKGEEIEADTRQLADGRRTHFTRVGELVFDLESAGFEIVDQQTIAHHPRLRGQHVQRENVQVIGRKAQDPQP